MEQSLEQRIRERAYTLWLENGCAEGNAEQHWIAAEREVLAMMTAQTPVSAASAARRSSKARATPTTAAPRPCGGPLSAYPGEADRFSDKGYAPPEERGYSKNLPSMNTGGFEPACLPRPGMGLPCGSSRLPAAPLSMAPKRIITSGSVPSLLNE